VLSTYLQACDETAIEDNLQPVRVRAIPECFAAGTPVTMADGSLKAIERIEPGDLVLAFDEARHTTTSARVEKRFVRAHTDRLIVVNGSLRATPNHLFHTERGWIAAESLSLGDALIGMRSARPSDDSRLAVEPAEVRALTVQPGSVTTYNLAVAVQHDFFAGGILVHDGP
jgi:hypothetical protein